MRVTETCSCGASIEVVWNEPKSSYDGAAVKESKRAKAEMADFRNRHSGCRLSKAARR